MNHENAICYCIDRVEPNYGFFCEQPLTSFMGNPNWAVTLGGASDSSNRVRGLDNRSFLMVEEAIQ